MKLSTFFLIVIFAAIAVFAALNWSTFSEPTLLSLGVATVEAPLGLIMLGMVAALAAIFLVYVLYMQTAVLMESRRQSRELQANRELADKAEASRFTELRAYIESELQAIGTRDAEHKAAIIARVDQLERAMRKSVEESGNTLAAYIGEIENRLEDATGKTRPILPARRDH